MPLRQDLEREAERKYLARDEVVQAVIWAVSVRPFLIWTLGFLIIERNYRVVICTNRRMLLCEVNGSSRRVLEALLDTADRGQRLGPPHGTLYRLDAFSSPVWVVRRFFKDIRRADSYVQGDTSL